MKAPNFDRSANNIVTTLRHGIMLKVWNSQCRALTIVHVIVVALSFLRFLSASSLSHYASSMSSAFAPTTLATGKVPVGNENLLPSSFASRDRGVKRRDAWSRWNRPLHHDEALSPLNLRLNSSFEFLLERLPETWTKNRDSMLDCRRNGSDGGYCVG